MLLLQSALFNLVGAEGLERVALEEGGKGEKEDEPFRGVVLVPNNCVSWSTCQSTALVGDVQRRKVEKTYDNPKGIHDGSYGIPLPSSQAR